MLIAVHEEFRLIRLPAREKEHINSAIAPASAPVLPLEDHPVSQFRPEPGLRALSSPFGHDRYPIILWVSLSLAVDCSRFH